MISHYLSKKLLTFPKRHCFGLTYIVRTLYNTVQDTDMHSTSLYVSSDLYCTVLNNIVLSTNMNCSVLNNTVRFYWHALLSTEQHCTFDWLILYRIEPYCTGCWYALYTFEHHRKGILTQAVQNCTTLNGDTDTHCPLLNSTQHIFLLNSIFLKYRVRLIRVN